MLQICINVPAHRSVVGCCGLRCTNASNTCLFGTISTFDYSLLHGSPAVDLLHNRFLELDNFNAVGLTFLVFKSLKNLIEACCTRLSTSTIEKVAYEAVDIARVRSSDTLYLSLAALALRVA